jgi:hypothetical protein
MKRMGWLSMFQEDKLDKTGYGKGKSMARNGWIGARSASVSDRVGFFFSCHHGIP